MSVSLLTQTLVSVLVFLSEPQKLFFSAHLNTFEYLSVRSHTLVVKMFTWMQWKQKMVIRRPRNATFFKVVQI